MTRYLDENSGKQIVIETNKKFNKIDSSLSDKANTSYVETKFGNMGSTKTFKGTCTNAKLLLKTGMLVDDYWYVIDLTTNKCYNGIEWVDIGNNLKIGDGTITPISLSQNVVIADAVNKNIFDLSKITNGYYLDASGVLTVGADWWVSPFILVPINTNYITTAATTSIFDVNKNFVSQKSSRTTFNTGSNVYIRVSGVNVNLALTQTELGTVATAYESGLPRITVAKIKDYDSGLNAKLNSFIFSDNNFVKPPMYSSITNKNIFDKSKVIKDHYVNYTTGIIGSATGWCVTDYVKINSSTNYHKNGCSLAFYDVDKLYISGVGASTYSFTSPSNAYYVKITCLLISLETNQVELGNVETDYESGMPLILKEQIKDLSSIIASINYENVIVVAKSGGDYNTIGSAITYAKTIATIINPVTILIMPGTYIEHVSIYGYPISLIGINRETCIIQDNSGDYYKPPLEMAGGNVVENLTLIATQDSNEGTTLRSYAIHHDFPGEGLSIIRNCKTISSTGACAIGIGLQNNQKLIIDNVESYSPTAPGLLMHPQTITATNQKLIVKNSRISTDSSSALSLIDSNNNGVSGGSGDNRDTTLSFYNNIIWSTTVGKTNLIYGTPPMGSGDYGYMTITLDSFGNNISELNK